MDEFGRSVNQMNLTKRKSSESDKQYLYGLNRRCYLQVVTDQFGAWDEAWQAEHFDKKWSPSKYEILIHDGQCIGAVAVRRDETSLFLEEVLIDTPFQNKGFGTAVIEDVFRKADKIGVPVRLQVLLKNRAISLYYRLGMRETGRTDTHVLMEKERSTK